MPVSIPNGGNTYDRTPEIRIQFPGVLPPGAFIRVRRNGTIIGNAVLISAGLYGFFDAAPIGSATYVAELVDGISIGASSGYSVTIQALPTPTVEVYSLEPDPIP